MIDSTALLAPFGDAQLAIGGIRHYAIFLLDPHGTVVSWNEGAQAIKGYSASEIVGQSSARFYTREDVLAGRHAQLLARAAQEGRVEDEGWRVRKDGSRFWADVVITAIRGADGALRGFVKITRDLTERKRGEEALRQGEERMRLMIDSVEEYAIFMLDPTGRVASWNSGAERLKGYTAREIVGQSFSRFYPEPEVRAGKPERELEIAEREGRFQEEGWRVRKDGSRFWASVVLSAVRDELGTLVGFTKVTRDMSDRKLAEEAMLERTRQQGAVAQLGVFAVEQPALDAVIHRAIDTVRDTLGTERVQVLELSDDGNSLTLRGGCGVDPAGVGRLAVAVDRGSQLLSPEPDPQGFPLAGLLDEQAFPSGITAVIRASARPLGVYGMLCAHTAVRRAFNGDDVNFLRSVANVIAAAIERRRMEEQVRVAERRMQEERVRTAHVQEALRERDEFISVAAHELRTPLTALQLKLQGLERGLKAAAPEKSAGSKVGGRLEGALRQTKRLSHLIERLLDVSRIAAGRLELAPERFDLAELVRQVAEDFREPAAETGTELRLHGAQRMEGCWDRLRMEQVLVNLLSNAVKYGAGRPVSVRLESAGERIRISVVDEGIGIAPEDLGRIFTRFERAAPVRNYAGLGLGLYISRYIVDAHGGRIEVSSRPGQGSTFVIDLPLVAALVTLPGQGPHQARA
ncbi:MAG TPA: PAS domain S-box protein [Myxococcales bacterium]